MDITHPLIWGYIVGWIVMVIVQIVLFNRKIPVERRKRFLRPWLFGISLLFILYTWVLPMPVIYKILFSTIVALIGWLNLKATKFCEHCGKTLYNQSFKTKDSILCKKCLSDLKKLGA